MREEGFKACVDRVSSLEFLDGAFARLKCVLDDAFGLCDTTIRRS